MSLTPGTVLGPYEIVAKLGEGGMGQVYRARDARLNRDVAIKVLPEHFADDAERLARFTREAQTLASLNHPNIAHIHGLEESGGVRALVMELVEGEDLSAVIERGPIPVAEALPIARQIAEALEAAHELGIVHRDLKPANIKVRPDGTVKVLDFGLAKALDPGVTSGVDSAKSPTLTARATQLGMILGTASYMAPEQARGKPVDKRADVWAFGVVLYEMLTGERAFGGDDVSDVLAGVLRQEIDWTKLPEATPPRVRELLFRCLAKDLKVRLQAIGEARIALTRADEPSGVFVAADGGQSPEKRGRSPSLWPWVIAAAALIGWAATAFILKSRPYESVSELRTSLVLPEGFGIPTLYYNGNGSVATLAVSPSGDQVAFIAAKEGEGALYLRRFDSFDAVRLTNTEGAVGPVFSPDGKALAFFARGHLWRIDLPGGVPVDVTPATQNSVGGSWGDDGRIIFTPTYADGLWTVSAAGGDAHELTKVDRAAGEISHRWPCVLPGSAAALFTIKLATSESFDDAHIAIADTKSGEHHVLLTGGSMPRYLDDGHLLFTRAGKLYAVPFELASRTIRGAPALVLDGVATGPMTGAAWYDVTRQGLLVYATGGRVSQVGRFSWEGPGRPVQILEHLDAGSFGGGIRLSRDFKRAVVQVGGANDKLWLIDLEQMNATRITSGGGNDNTGVVSPDGRWLLFGSDRAGGGYGFYRMPLGGAASPEAFMKGTGQLNAISYSTRMLGFSLDVPKNGADAYVLAIAEDGTPAGKPILVAGGPGDQVAPAVSADGKLVAYQSAESGRDEIYVAPLADLGSRRRVTNDGGAVPVWSREGSRMFYQSSNRIFSVTLRSAPELRFDPPQAVTAPEATGEIVGFDVAADGTSVLVGRIADPLMLRRDIRLWPGWGSTLRSVK
jgi:serine/threonine-protein kinase